MSDLADVPQWVAWRVEDRNGKPTKIPYSPVLSGEKAAADNPSTWAPRAQAEREARRLLKGGRAGGVGLMLGPIVAAPDLCIGGVDLDSCRDPESGCIAQWAADLIERFATYAEVSPSGTGAKLFFVYRAADLPALRRAMGTDHGRQFKRDKGQHPAAIELYTGNRYFALTGAEIPDRDPEIAELLGSTPALQPVPAEELLRLINEAGTAFAGIEPSGGSRDESGSGYGFRFMADQRAAGATYSQAVDAIMDDGGPAGEWAARVDDRQLRRAYAGGRKLDNKRRADVAAKFDDLGEPEPPKGTLTLVRMGELARLPEAQDFVQGVLFERAVSVVFGAPGAGKTFFALDLALHVAMGRAWHGRGVEPGGVIYIGLEGVDGLRRRRDAWCQFHEIENADALPIAFMHGSLNLRQDQQTRAAIVAASRKMESEWGVPVRWIIVDTLSRAMAGGNENASEDMGGLFAGADQLRRETGAHVTLIHHSGKDQTAGARGHSSLLGNVDTEIEITRDGTLNTARLSKQKEGPDGLRWIFTLAPVDLGRTDRWGARVTSQVAIPSTDAFDDLDGARLNARQRSALEILRCLLAETFRDDTGQPNEGDKGGCPPAVPLSAWRDALRAEKWPGGQEGDNSPDGFPSADSFKKAWQRVRKDLSEQGLIEIRGNMVRLPDA